LIELADTSAWTASRRLPDVRTAFDEFVLAGSIATCDAVAMELLREARDGVEFDRRHAQLERLRRCPISERAWRRAIDVMHAFADSSTPRHRGLPMADLLIAAAAELAEVPVLHYDRHFELIAEVTGQPVRAIAPLGSL
jgi:predicted nucleic acid-binding protein